MSAKLRLGRFTLQAKLTSSYLVILAAGGLATSVLGSWIVDSTIMNQARRKVDHDLEIARMVYAGELAGLRQAVNLAASGLSSGNSSELLPYLDRVRTEIGADFFSLTDEAGRVIVRATQPGKTMDEAALIPVVGAALSGEIAAATEILTAEQLGQEHPSLSSKSYFRFVDTPHAKVLDKSEETSGMVLIAAAPVRGSENRIVGALYGGILLNRNPALVDRVWELVYKGEKFEGQDIGTVTIFQGDLRISTNVKTASGERALGTRVSEEVYNAVLVRGEVWRDRAFVVNDWYISSYEPIRNFRGDIVGILYVGLLEKAYTSISYQVIVAFFAIATGGFLLIMGITYAIIRNITRPIAEMAAATRNIAVGRFDQDVKCQSHDEIGLLAGSFNNMLKSLRVMRQDLENWARTLEVKVEERTQELVAMQSRVAQSERLASLGKLAAGVAHEINNPLGGILSLTTLTLEEMESADPNRESLEEVVRQTERCRDIVRGLLEFSRQSEVKTEPVDLNRLLENTLSLIDKQALFHNIKLVRDWAPDLPPVMADRSQLQQVFMNIILNAVQAMNGRGTLTVATQHHSTDTFAQVRIADTGVGIPTEKIGRIFDPFYTTKAGGKGTGLGLSIAYGIVARHGGTISVESRVGQGSTFTIRIPALSHLPEEPSDEEIQNAL